MEHAADRPAPVEERLRLLREILSGVAPGAAEPPILHCLDGGFRFVPTPESLRVTGLPDATERLAVGEIRSLVSDRDNRALLGAIGQARTTGIGSCRMSCGSYRTQGRSAMMTATPPSGTWE